MARPTDIEREKARIKNDDPAAPLFDAVDRLHRRLDGVLSNLRGAATTAAQQVVVPELRRELVRSFFAMSAMVAVAATAMAIIVTTSTLQSAEARAQARADAIEEERSKGFAARVAQRASELAASQIADANRRAAAAEAEVANARATVLALSGRAGDEDVRALMAALVIAPRGHQHVVWRLLRHGDPNVRSLALKLTELQSGEVSRIQHYLEKGTR